MFSGHYALSWHLSNILGCNTQVRQLYFTFKSYKTIIHPIIDPFNIQFDLNLFPLTATTIGRSKQHDLFYPITVLVSKNNWRSNFMSKGSIGCIMVFPRLMVYNGLNGHIEQNYLKRNLKCDEWIYKVKEYDWYVYTLQEMYLLSWLVISFNVISFNILAASLHVQTGLYADIIKQEGFFLWLISFVSMYLLLFLVH